MALELIIANIIASIANNIASIIANTNRTQRRWITN